MMTDTLGLEAVIDSWGKDISRGVKGVSRLFLTAKIQKR